MRNFTLFKMSVALVASLLSAQSTFGQGTITSFEAEGQTLHSDSGFGFRGSFGNVVVRLPNSTISAQLDLNNEDTTVTFRRVEVDIEDVLELSGDFPRGFGETIPIEGTIDFDSSIVFADDEALTLGLGQNNQFPINNFFRNLGSSEQTRLTGSYEFSGPTESVEGQFSVSPRWTRYGAPTIDTTHFPNEVDIVLSRPHWSKVNPNFNLVNETVDGIAISIELDTASIVSPDFEFQNTMIIPEPSEYALMMGLGLLGFVMFRRVRGMSLARTE